MTHPALLPEQSRVHDGMIGQIDTLAIMAAMTQSSPWRLTTAPMMDWSDRHCRFFFRLLSPHARLYTEMITAAALVHGNVPKHLDYNAEEHPVALQLGGCDPHDLAIAAKLGAQWGYDEINLNCGCPSERVQKGAFGACLMAEPELVRDGVKAMRDVVSVPVTVKHRIGIDAIEHYDFVRDFVGTVSEGGCAVFIVHARNAILKGLSPKENREVPPLKYDYVAQLKRDFPALTFVLNGGLSTVAQCEAALQTCDGVMLGRTAYHDPWILTACEQALFRLPNVQDEATLPRQKEIIVEAMIEYCCRAVREGAQLKNITRHILGLYQGMNGAKAWRRTLSDPKLLMDNDPKILRTAMPHNSMLSMIA
jgi:tRNA-dihydrouridine synthase A